jgi:hypothetical protein
MLVSAVLSKYSMELVVAEVFVRNSAHEVLKRREHMGKKY